MDKDDPPWIRRPTQTVAKSEAMARQYERQKGVGKRETDIKKGVGRGQR